jgi:hypothetical protein
MKLEFSYIFSENTQILNFIKILPVGAELFHSMNRRTNGQTYGANSHILKLFKHKVTLFWDESRHRHGYRSFGRISVYSFRFPVPFLSHGVSIRSFRNSGTHLPNCTEPQWRTQDFFPGGFNKFS